MNRSKGLILFIKYPEAGKVKTRLAKTIGHQKALELYESFIRETLTRLQKVEATLHLFFTPDCRQADMESWLGTSNCFPLHPQQGNHLGERMISAFKAMFNLGFDYCLITGSDVPDAPVAVFTEAFNSLKSTPAIIAPTKDGGYYLLGFQKKNFCEAIFHNVDWSTNRVFQQTMNIFKQNNMTPCVLQEWQDVDTIDDLKDLQQRGTLNLPIVDI